MAKPKPLNRLQWFKNLRPTKDFAPYDVLPGTKGRKNGKVSKDLKKYSGVPGVYIISDKTGKVVYVGATGYSLYTSAIHRFQSWNRKTYEPGEGHTIRVIPIRNDPKRERIFRVEVYFIKKYDPEDNTEGRDFLPFDPNSGESKDEYFARREREESKAFEDYIKSGGQGFTKLMKERDLEELTESPFSFLKEILPF